MQGDSLLLFLMVLRLPEKGSHDPDPDPDRSELTQLSCWDRIDQSCKTKNTSTTTTTTVSLEDLQVLQQSAFLQ